MLRRLYDWTMSLAATPNAERALFGVAFVESSVFPIPPDVLLIPMTLSAPQRWLRFAILCTIGSVLGAFLGYGIGKFLYDSIGVWILDAYGMTDKFDRIAEWYNTYGGWGVLFAAVTPFPYKVLTIFSGATGLNIFVFALVSVVGRAMRFLLVTWLLSRFGEPIRVFIEKYLSLLFALFVVLLLGGFYAVKYVF